jgi:four helix bundle protein
VQREPRGGNSLGFCVEKHSKEANEALSKKDLLLHLRIARKESREMEFWLSVLHEFADRAAVQALQQEARELSKILTSIIKKSEQKK